MLSKEQYNNKYKVAVKPISERSEVLSCDTAKGLYTKNISASATRFDTYHHCHFMYFCRYGLKVLKVQPASLDVMQRGTLVHYVLEQFCNRPLCVTCGTLSVFMREPFYVKTYPAENTLCETDIFFH